jgi:hypothetical protein
MAVWLRNSRSEAVPIRHPRMGGDDFGDEFGLEAVGGVQGRCPVPLAHLNAVE